jgi:hypothetical protein
MRCHESLGPLSRVVPDSDRGSPSTVQGAVDVSMVPAFARRLRSNTPVSIGTPFAVICLSGMVADPDELRRNDAESWVIVGIVLLVFGGWLISCLDRLLRMRARDASWRMLSSLTIVTALFGSASVAAVTETDRVTYDTRAGVGAGLGDCYRTVIC